MIMEINENNQGVWALIPDNKKKLKPVWFIWSSRVPLVQEITCVLDRKDVALPSYTILAVTDGANLFPSLIIMTLWYGGTIP